MAAGYTVAIHHSISCQHWPSLCALEGERFLFIHPYAYQGILLSSGFGLVFRLNQSYSRYWEARSAVQSASAKWIDGVAMSLAFDDESLTSAVDPKHAGFARCVLHLASLLHAIAMAALRGDTELGTLVTANAAAAAATSDATPPPSSQSVRLRGCCESTAASVAAFSARNPLAVLGGITEEELRLLGPCTQRFHLVAGWLQRLLVRRRRRGGLSHDAPIVSRIYQVFSDGNLWYLAALKVCDTPL